MTTYAISDLHVHQENQPFLFTPDKEIIFDRLADEILGNQGELIIAGDFIDFTGMENPKKGHEEFFSDLFSGVDLQHPAIIAALREDDKKSQISLIGARFQKLFKRLGELAQAEKLSIMPGNHDCYFRDHQLQKIFADQIGVDASKICWSERRRVGKVTLAEHGNHFDPSNQTDKGCRNPGTAITSALYKALMPALRVFGLPENIVYSIPAVRPEEIVMHGIEQYLGEANARQLVAAFVGLIAKNGYFPWWKQVLLLPVRHRIPAISNYFRAFLTPERLRRTLPDESLLKISVRKQAEAMRLQLSPEARTVVLGHTHVLDATDHYLNLGTWIDHMTGISLDHLEMRDISLPVLRLESNGDCDVYDARELIHEPRLSNCRKVYRENYRWMQGS